MEHSRPIYRELLATNQHLRIRVADLQAQLATAYERIAELEAQLNVSRVEKDSATSSCPPSQDPPLQAPRRRSLRRRSGRRPGGQRGHPGHGLSMSAPPTSVHYHRPAYCSTCGRPVVTKDLREAGRDQEIDLPPVTVDVTEHRFSRSQCASGTLTGHAAPHSGVHYGPRVLALTAYLSNRQYLPYQRLAELLHDLCHLSVSPGTLVTAVRNMADASRPAYDAIRRALLHAPCVGSDETGLKVTGRRAWAWIWQNPTLTFLGLSSSRGTAAITTFYPDGLPNSVLVSDRWAAQLKTPARHHQLCLAHLLRDLQYCRDGDGSSVAYHLQQLFL